MSWKCWIIFGFLAASATAAPRFGSGAFAPFNADSHDKYRCGARWSLDEDSLHNYNVVKIEANLFFDFDLFEIGGYTITSLTTQEQPLSCIPLRLVESLTVDSVWILGIGAADYTRDGPDSLQVHLDFPVQVGETLSVGIAYHGETAIIDDWGGLRFEPEAFWRPAIAFSMGDGLDLDPPPANHTWFPCFSDPTDKLLWEAWFRVPEDKTVTTAGVRMDTVSHGDGTMTWHYRLDQPVSTYLLFVAVSDYIIMVQRESDPIIENFVYPNRVSQAEEHFSNVPAVFNGFVHRFGPYPFGRMGFCMTRLGDMEHATCVSHVDQTVQTNHTYDWLLFHEMSHQWWGDWVTLGDWRDLWLNEGFATFCEAIGMEILGGPEAYQYYVEHNLFPAARSANDSYSVYDPDYYWGSTVYEKGACVMHMLRQLMGDSLFFTALRDYGQQFSYGSAVTDDWQAVCEAYYGEDMDWFFEPWLRGTKYPRYHVTQDIGETYTLTIEQQQTWDTYFRMPVDIRYYHEGGDSTTITLWNEAVPSQSYTEFEHLPLVIDSMIFDPDGKILKTVTYETIEANDPAPGLPETFRLSSVYPNPFNPALTIAYDLPAASRVALRVYNTLGRMVDQRDVGIQPPGSHKLVWDGSGFSSGVYLFCLETPAVSRTVKAVLLK